MCAGRCEECACVGGQGHARKHDGTIIADGVLRQMLSFVFFHRAAAISMLCPAPRGQTEKSNIFKEEAGRAPVVLEEVAEESSSASGCDGTGKPSKTSALSFVAGFPGFLSGSSVLLLCMPSLMSPVAGLPGSLSGSTAVAFAFFFFFFFSCAAPPAASPRGVPPSSLRPASS